jgi:hypothetical protein
VGTPARTHHHRHSRSAAIRRSGARAKQHTAKRGAGASCSVRRAGTPRFASRPGHGAGTATSIDGPERPLQGRARAAAPRAPPSNLGCLLHAAARSTGAGRIRDSGQRIRKRRNRTTAMNQPVNHHGQLNQSKKPPEPGQEGILPLRPHHSQ